MSMNSLPWNSKIILFYDTCKFPAVINFHIRFANEITTKYSTDIVFNNQVKILLITVEEQ